MQAKRQQERIQEIKSDAKAEDKPSSHWEKKTGTHEIHNDKH